MHAHWPSLFVRSYVGMETGYGAFITSYSVIHLGRPEGEGQLLASAYWGALMLGRLGEGDIVCLVASFYFSFLFFVAAVPISMRVAPSIYLGSTMAGCVVAALVLVAGQSSVEAVWVGSVLFGFFMASVFPTAIGACCISLISPTRGTCWYCSAALQLSLRPTFLSR